MNKFISLCIALVIVVSIASVSGLIVSITGLDSGEDNDILLKSAFSVDSVLKELDSYSDTDGLSVSVKSFDLISEKSYVEILWKNETEFNVTYGLGYDIQEEIDGEWKSCASEDIIVQSIACLLDSGEKNTQKYDLSVFDIKPDTRYRFSVECYVSSNGEYEPPETCKLYIEFIIE